MLRLVSIALLALAAASPLGAAPSKPSAVIPARELVLTGTLTRADHEHYREVPFEVPENATRITVRFSYDGKEQGSVIDLGLLDPVRFRGWGGGSHPDFTLSAEDASPGFLSGPLPPGRWRLLLGVPNLRSGARSRYEARIRIDTELAPVEFAAAPLSVRAGWYRGDLHSHSGQSDGTCLSQSGLRVPCPVERTMAAAAARGLDFLALTDHNAMAHFDALRDLQPAYDRLLLVPGREMTTFWGHANVFGPTAFLDFRTAHPDASEAQWLEQAKALGGLISINHPALPSGEACMGCGWQVDGIRPGTVEAVEVVNGGTMAQTGKAEGQLQGFAFWHERLNRGDRIVGVGGSDNHDPDRPAGQVGAIGSPTTVAYLPELSVAGLLAGLRSGRVFIDIEATGNRILDMTARTPAGEAVMGGKLGMAEGMAAQFSVALSGVAEGQLVVTLDGREAHRLSARFAGRKFGSGPLTFTWHSDGGKHWLRADVRSRDGRLLLVGNPIYVAPPGSP
jgi:hypothetical protein